jgi:hypothetical protein
LRAITGFGFGKTPTANKYQVPAQGIIDASPVGKRVAYVCFKYLPDGWCSNGNFDLVRSA